jgi:hypothetical protein
MGVISMGRIAKGVYCSVIGCEKQAIRSLSKGKVNETGLKVIEEKRAYLCRDHYKEFKKNPAVKKKKMIDKWRLTG